MAANLGELEVKIKANTDSVKSDLDKISNQNIQITANVKANTTQVDSAISKLKSPDKKPTIEMTAKMDQDGTNELNNTQTKLDEIKKPTTADINADNKDAAKIIGLTSSGLEGIKETTATINGNNEAASSAIEATKDELATLAEGATAKINAKKNDDNASGFDAVLAGIEGDINNTSGTATVSAEKNDDNNSGFDAVLEGIEGDINKASGTAKINAEKNDDNTSGFDAVIEGVEGDINKASGTATVNAKKNDDNASGFDAVIEAAKGDIEGTSGNIKIGAVKDDDVTAGFDEDINSIKNEVDGLSGSIKVGAAKDDNSTSGFNEDINSIKNEVDSTSGNIQVGAVKDDNSTNGFQNNIENIQGEVNSTSGNIKVGAVKDNSGTSGFQNDIENIQGEVNQTQGNIQVGAEKDNNSTGGFKNDIESIQGEVNQTEGNIQVGATTTAASNSINDITEGTYEATVEVKAGGISSLLTDVKNIVNKFKSVGKFADKYIIEPISKVYELVNTSLSNLTQIQQLANKLGIDFVSTKTATVAEEKTGVSVEQVYDFGTKMQEYAKKQLEIIERSNTPDNKVSKEELQGALDFFQAFFPGIQWQQILKDPEMSKNVTNFINDPYAMFSLWTNSAGANYKAKYGESGYDSLIAEIYGGQQGDVNKYLKAMADPELQKMLANLYDFYSKIYTEDNLEKVESFTNANIEFNATISALKDLLAIQISPVFTTALSGVTSFLQEATDILSDDTLTSEEKGESLASSFKNKFSEIIDGLKTWWNEDFKPLLEPLKDVLNGIANIVSTYFKEFADILYTRISKILKLVFPEIADNASLTMDEEQYANFLGLDYSEVKDEFALWNKSDSGLIYKKAQQIVDGIIRNNPNYTFNTESLLNRVFEILNKPEGYTNVGEMFEALASINLFDFLGFSNVGDIIGNGTSGSSSGSGSGSGDGSGNGLGDVSASLSAAANTLSTAVNDFANADLSTRCDVNTTVDVRVSATEGLGAEITNYNTTKTLDKGMSSGIK